MERELRPSDAAIPDEHAGHTGRGGLLLRAVVPGRDEMARTEPEHQAVHALGRYVRSPRAVGCAGAVPEDVLRGLPVRTVPVRVRGPERGHPEGGSAGHTGTLCRGGLLCGYVGGTSPGAHGGAGTDGGHPHPVQHRPRHALRRGGICPESTAGTAQLFCGSASSYRTPSRQDVCGQTGGRAGQFSRLHAHLAGTALG